MKFDIHILYLFLAIGALRAHLKLRDWILVCILILAWMSYNVLKS